MTSICHRERLLLLCGQLVGCSAGDVEHPVTVSSRQLEGNTGLLHCPFCTLVLPLRQGPSPLPGLLPLYHNSLKPLSDQRIRLSMHGLCDRQSCQVGCYCLKVS